MPEFFDAADSPFVFVETENVQQAADASFPRLCDDFESLSIPNRGIVLAILMSSILWAFIILGGRSLWLVLH